MGGGVQFLELQRLLEELLEHGITLNPDTQRVVAQVTAQRAGVAPDSCRRRRAKGSVGRTGLAAPRARGFRLRKV
jgi:hypothetical protein